MWNFIWTKIMDHRIRIVAKWHYIVILILVIIGSGYAWQHKAITWTKVDFSSVRSSGIHLGFNTTRDTSAINHQKLLENYFQLNLPEANELNEMIWTQFPHVESQCIHAATKRTFLKAPCWAGMPQGHQVLPMHVYWDFSPCSIMAPRAIGAMKYSTKW